MKIIIASLLSLTVLLSCSKNKEEISIPHKYSGDWDFVANYGSLYFFYINVNLHENGSGTISSFMKDNNFQYAESLAQWSRGAGDSIVLQFEIPAYPAESWEFRGIGNTSNTLAEGNYFVIDKTTKKKTLMGTAALKED